MDNQETKKGISSGVVIALIVAIILLGGLSGYLYTQISELEQKLTTQAENIEENEDEISDLTSNLEQKIAEYNDLKAEYEELGLSYEDLDAQIADLEASVQKYKNASWANKKELKKVRKELQLTIAKHQLDLADKDQEIERYKLLADSLATSVDSLLIEQGVAIEKINNLASKVQIASILKAEGLTIVGINKKGKEDDDKELKAKQVSKVKIAFNYADNKVAKHDVKSVVFKLIQPDGSVVFDLATGGGSFTTSEGKTEFYTSKKEIRFDNTKQVIDFYYTIAEGELLSKGTFNIEVYTDGYKIGTDSFTVK